MFNVKFPWSESNMVNLDWIINEIKKLHSDWSDFRVVNSIRFYGIWHIDRGYPAWSLVSLDNVGYISTQIVPAGVDITNEDYWKPVADYSALLADMQERIVNIEKLPLLANKRVLVIGDSISAEADGQRNWVTLLREKYTPTGTIIDNISMSGATLSGDGNLSLAHKYATEVTATYDYIIIWAGINDFFQQFTLGKLSPTFTNVNYFNGALAYLYNNIVLKNKKAEVFYICPPKSSYELEHPMPVDIYRLLILNACNMYNWHFINMVGEEPFLNIYGNIREWTDGVHPNAELTPYLAKFIDKKLNCYGGNYISFYKNSMSLTNFCEIVEADTTAKLDFDTNQNAILSIQVPNISYEETNYKLLLTLPEWLKPQSTMYGIAVLNGIYNESVSIETNGQVILRCTRSAIGNISITFNIPLNLVVDKTYS